MDSINQCFNNTNYYSLQLSDLAKIASKFNAGTAEKCGNKWPSWPCPPHPGHHPDCSPNVSRRLFMPDRSDWPGIFLRHLISILPNMDILHIPGGNRVNCWPLSSPNHEDVCVVEEHGGLCTSFDRMKKN
jgi:hypothetical protein